MNFLVPSQDSYISRRNLMASQSFQAIRRLQDAGAPLPLVLANPAWQALMDKIDANIAERSAVLEHALEKLPLNKRPVSTFVGDEYSESTSKRQRMHGAGGDLASRKDALLAKIDNIEGGSAGQDDYEAYRRQCWLQYYEWMEKQKQGGVADGRTDPVPPPPATAAPAETSSEDEDEEIHNALLGLS